MKWTPDMIIAIIIVCGTLALLFTGIDSEVKSVFLLAAGYSFGTGRQMRKSSNGGKGK